MDWCSWSQVHQWRGRPAGPGPVRGSAHPASKLSEPDVVEILRLARTGRVTRKDLAARYGVSPGLVTLVAKRQLWRHVEDPCAGQPVKWRARVPHRAAAKLRIEDVREIRRLVRRGYSHAELARRYGVSRTTVTLLVNQRTWAGVP